MKSLYAVILALFAAAAGCAADKPADKPLVIGTTIDFLDYAFNYKGPEDHFALEAYENDLKQLAESGVKKIYLRVNVCGTTHYPTKVSARYGDGDAFHWYVPEKSMRLINTYKHYDPCTETIRIGHKYGMEVWAWESLFDDAGVQLGYPENGDPKWQAAWKRLNGWALLDPFYLDNPDALAMRDPRLIPSPEAVEKANREAAAKPIARIVFTNTPKHRNLPPPRLKSADDVKIFVSSDNMIYTRYTGKFTFASSVTPDGRNRFEISGLEIKEPYVKFAHNGFPLEGFSLVLDQARGQCEVYNTDGKLIPSVWGWVRNNNPKPENTAIALEQTGIGWDCLGREIGFKAGEIEPKRYAYGMAEFNVPKAMKHKVDRFAELAAYPFDGFMFNIRTHSPAHHPEEYGFNPEVLAKFRERYGRDYQGGNEDLEKLFTIRGEGIADFFKNCKALTGGRPIYFSGPLPREFKDELRFKSAYNKNFGPMEWLYKRYFADGSIDGVIMIGNWGKYVNFSHYFTPEVTGGKPIKLGVFREMLAGRPRNYDLDADLKMIRAEGLDEVELYESVVLNRNPVMLEIIKGNTPENWDAAAYKWK